MKKKAKSPGKSMKNGRYHANTKFLETFNAQFQKIMPDEGTEYEAAIALTTLGSTAARLSPVDGVDRESVRSASIDVEVVTDTHEDGNCEGLGTDNDSDQRDPYSEYEDEFGVDSQQATKQVDNHLPLREVRFDFTGDFISDAEESTVDTSGICAKQTAGSGPDGMRVRGASGRGMHTQPQSTSLVPSSRQTTRYSVTLPIPSDDDDDDGPIDDDPMVREVRERVAQQNKLRKAEEPLTKGRGVRNMKQGETWRIASVLR
jgi:hypothetical protein